MKQTIRETALYPPVKALLESQGYEVKGEIGAADVVARRGDEEPVIVELKTGFTLSLVHQAIERQSLTDAVYIAVPHGRGRAFARSLKANRRLCRRLGLGLMCVRLPQETVEVLLDPSFAARRVTGKRAARRRALLLREFERRVGDPAPGGATRGALMTAYRQDALRCAQLLSTEGPTKAAGVARSTGVEQARRIMASDHYGWFERVQRGIYGLTPKGSEAVTAHAETLSQLNPAPSYDAGDAG